MADFIKTITNSLNMFGGSPSSKWGSSNYPYTMTWGSTKWGEGTFTTVFSIEKLISNSILPNTLLSFQSEKLITNAITVSGDMYSEELSDGLWKYIFNSDTTDGERRSQTNWSDNASNSTIYTTATAASTIWS